eukprot:3856935-Amphidinium_carterae.1
MAALTHIVKHTTKAMLSVVKAHHTPKAKQTQDFTLRRLQLWSVDWVEGIPLPEYLAHFTGLKPEVSCSVLKVHGFMAALALRSCNTVSGTV